MFARVEAQRVYDPASASHNADVPAGGNNGVLNNRKQQNRKLLPLFIDVKIEPVGEVDQ